MLKLVVDFFEKQQEVKVDILIPVYNRPDLLSNLWMSFLNNSNFKLINEVIIGDDFSDDITSKFIKEISLVSPVPVRVLRGAGNQGFVKNSNNLYNNSNANYFILLNTDTLVPPFWIERMLYPLLIDDKVALATPLSTSAANHTVMIPEGHTWVDCDKILSQLSAKYPDACTAIGFCMAVQRKAILARKFLFDEAFGMGYGEETDLHYYLISMKFKSIIVDNLIVHHVGGATFNQVEKNNLKIQKNRELFFSRWGELHSKKENEYINNKSLHSKVDMFNSSLKVIKKEHELDVLFVLPSIVNKTGGVSVILDLTDRLISCNIKANVFCMFSNYDEEYVQKRHTLSPFTRKSLSSIKSVKLVIATHFSTVAFAEECVKKFKCDFSYFVQGPEVFFDNGVSFQEIIHDYVKINDYILVSDYLFRFINKIKYPVELNRSSKISLGPDHLIYYPKNAVIRKPKTIAGCVRNSLAKGTPFLLNFLYYGKKHGFEIHLFGKDTEMYKLDKSFAICHGDLNEYEIAKLFAEVEFYADFSVYEGLGLLPLEASFCGAIPILSKNGGANYIFKDKVSAIFVDNILDSENIYPQIAAFTQEEKNNISGECIKLRSNYSVRYAYDEFNKILKVNYNIDESNNRRSYFNIDNNNLKFKISNSFQEKYSKNKIYLFLSKVKSIFLATIYIYKHYGFRVLIGRVLVFVGRKIAR